MTARGAGILGSTIFILLLAFGSYLLDVPAPTVIVGSIFAIVVVLWVGTRDAAGSGRSFTADVQGSAGAAGGDGRAAVQGAPQGAAKGTAPRTASRVAPEASPGTDRMVGKATDEGPGHEPSEGSRAS